MSVKKPLAYTERQRTGKSIKREYQTTRSTDTTSNVSIGLVDHDAAVMYYLQKVIKPTVIDNGERIPVPILYANSERWKSIQKDGFLRDKKNQVIVPVIVFKRTVVEKNESLPATKINALDPKLYYSFEKVYTKENRYSNFSVLLGQTPSREFYQVTMPRYVTLSYEFIIWTSYVEQMNSIIEKIDYTDGSYWGEPGKLRFKCNVESFNDSTELDAGERIIKTDFMITLYGYLIPEDFDNKVTTQKTFSPSKVNFITETVTNIDDIVKK